ncbi:MAG: endonuclease/exonuclease/phosphatase family protein [Planctomycetaceae bacterium]|nr:endonuclease/exonuclease/phosphatase family protein [Planctomycetaceae bacterium]
MSEPARRRHHSFRVPIIGLVYDGWRALQRLLSGADWSARLLRLSRHDAGDESGLVFVQIDGLSRQELERAMESGRMPRLRKLLDREGYELHTVYAGLPSTTPACQAELFYGVKAAVPAFAFGVRAAGKVENMLDSDMAAAVEHKLAASSPGLLAGGSASSNIYAGGAAEPHFCAATMGWNGLFVNASRLSILLAVMWNLAGVTRIVGKLLWEVPLIAFDLVRGLCGRLDLKREWEYIPSRIGVGIVLEELMTMAACVDVVRGLPIVQFNFLAYDERGHLRGPHHRFAHAALGRIDAAIARVARAAHRSQARHYSLWIYSDHGQEAVRPYEQFAGGRFTDAVGRAFAYDKSPIAAPIDRRFSRNQYWLPRRRPRHVATEERAALSNDLLVAAIGPVGHIYLPRSMTTAAALEGCRRLATEEKTPLVLRKLDDDTLAAWTADGEFRWPQDAARIFGEEHPFLAALGEDVARLCRHPDAGDVVVFAWRKGLEPITFVKELGAHAGGGVRETSAFALVPADAPLHADEERTFLRHTDLRDAVLRHLGRSTQPQRRRLPRLEARPLRIATYNVHSCVGLDGRLSPARIARVLARCDADVVALQELDVLRVRTGRTDQVFEIAKLLEADYHLFHPARSIADEQYGDAIISRLPLRLVKAGCLPGYELQPFLETRGAIWAAVEWQGREVQIVNTHLGLLREERRRQVETLLGPEWLGHPDCRNPVVFCGDLNLMPGAAPFRRITETFRDCQAGRAERRAQKTWFGPYPLARIDHLFLRGPVEATRVDVPRTQLTMVASDHLPLVVDLQWQLVGWVERSEAHAVAAMS